jgi:signal transduction histidine kinase/ActR/RegA family two-component response regulator
MPMAPAFATMMAGETAWALGAALEPIVVELSLKRVCIDLRILGTITAILGLMAFVLRYTGRFGWLKARRFGAICAPALPLIALAWTDPWHHLYFARLSKERIGGAVIAIRSFGPGLWAVFAYCYALAAVATVLLVQAVIRSRGVHRAQAAVMLFGVLLPWVVDFLDMAGIIPFIPVDLVSPTFVVTGLTFLPALFRFHLLDLPPVAWAVVVKGMDDPVVLIDASGRIVELNPAAQRLIGRESHEVAGIEAARAFPEWPALADRLSGREAQGVSLERGGPDPTLSSSFDPRISPLGDDVRPSGWVLVLRDITGLKRAEEERVRMLREQASGAEAEARMLREQAARAEAEAKMLREQAARAEAEAASQAKDRFLAVLSHELRTPLTPVLIAVSSLLESKPDPALLPTLEMIRRNIELEARLIDDLLDLSLIGRGRLRLDREVVDIHRVIHSTVEICRGEASVAGLDVVTDLNARHHHVVADHARLMQVAWNLIRNAAKFTRPHGRLTIRTINLPGPCGLGDLPDDGSYCLVIEFEDTGIGIDPAVLPRIFDAFEQGRDDVRGRSGGLGLGLAISRALVEALGGRLTASSQGRGLGSTFRLELTTVPGPAPTAVKPTGSATAPSASACGLGVRILLVEDNADTLRFLAIVLRQRGHEVVAADCIAAARAAMTQAKAPFDLLLSDIELPDGSGLQLMRELSTRWGLPGIAMSGFGSEEDLQVSREAGFVDHLTKPIDLNQLDAAIHRAAGHASALFDDEEAFRPRGWGSDSGVFRLVSDREP